ncbi:SGNH/GDSL hydrolase family protein [Rhodoferax sp. PAMC 29310]|uniref:SGNH/GDSL hydrolase family protein n=1 Tax=Rhodoferax sp. PAMC 29310 TaxID=2822760 RepID=UPI001B332A12|nr:SGNH/GDSL hydrolase family protein [Rhodoferax sp. PAMC 29310]
MTFKFLRALLLPLVLSVPLGAMAGPYSSMIVFGDSLSDTGNLSLASSGFYPELANGPYSGGRYSDGPVWVEGLASGLGLPGAATPYLLGGNNYAYAGARTGVDLSPPGVLAQALGIWGATHTGPADPNALYVVVGGGNDMRDARSVIGGDSLTRMTAAASAFNNLATTVTYLANKGVKNMLIANLPDLGFTPEAIRLGLQAESSDASAAFNSFFGSLMGYGSSLGVHMNLLDMAGIATDVRLNPSLYGVTNTNKPCAGFLGSEGASCAQSAFSDELHPSALVHSLFARSALVVLGVPEPGSLALFGLAVIALVAVRRRQTS